MGDERGPKLSLKGISAGGRVDYPSVRLTTNQLSPSTGSFCRHARHTIAYLQLPWLISFRINEKMFPITTV